MLYSVWCFSDKSEASLFKKIDVSLLHPPVHAKMIGVNDESSTLLIRSSYTSAYPNKETETDVFVMNIVSNPFEVPQSKT